MKKFEIAELVALELNKTAFGPDNPENPDAEKTQTVIDGVQGWEQEFGQASNN